MKKISIITRHFISNYGSFIQTYVFCEKLSELGNTPLIIDYIPSEENILRTTFTNSKNKKLHGFSKLLYCLISFLPGFILYAKFLVLRKKYLPLSNRVNERTISSFSSTTDVYISGSDQIWGPIGTKEYDLNYFLSFTDSLNKLAYSSSFGYINFSSNLKNNIVLHLKKYKWIGVREQSAVDYLEQLGIKAELVLDPVFLYDLSFYLKTIIEKHDMKNKYILLYQLHNNSSIAKYAKKISAIYNMPVYNVSPNMLHCMRFHYGRFKLVYNPFIFLGYVKNASYILTDSFHCTSFSIIFNKQFATFSPGKTSTRIDNILEMFDLNKRCAKNSSINVFETIIDYHKINEKVNIEREHSISLLKKALEEC